MRISRNDGERIGLGGAQQTGKTGKATGSRGTTGSTGGSSVDRVDVSSTGEVLHQALSVDASQRNDKVAELTKLYKSGNLQVDAEKLSEAILNEAQKTYSED